MIVVCDYGNGGDVLVTLDLKRLGISGKLSAVDVETGARLETTGDRTVRCTLKKHDFKVLRRHGAAAGGWETMKTPWIEPRTLALSASGRNCWSPAFRRLCPGIPAKAGTPTSP